MVSMTRSEERASFQAPVRFSELEIAERAQTARLARYYLISYFLYSRYLVLQPSSFFFFWHDARPLDVPGRPGARAREFKRRGEGAVGRAAAQVISLSEPSKFRF